MAHFRRLSVPSFDLTWIEIENSFYVLIPGGGGSLKVFVYMMYIVKIYKDL